MSIFPRNHRSDQLRENDGVKLRERIERIEKEASHVWAQFGVTMWERARLEEWKSLSKLSDKQEEILVSIEAKVFGDE